MTMKLIMESWRKYLVERDLTDPDIAYMSSATGTDDAVKRAETVKAIYREAGPLIASLWNNTAGKIFFKIPGTSGAEEYTFEDMGLDLLFTLFGFTVGAKLIVKAIKKLADNEKQMKAAAAGMFALASKHPSIWHKLTGEAVGEASYEPLIKASISNFKEGKGLGVVELPSLRHKGF